LLFPSKKDTPHFWISIRGAFRLWSCQLIRCKMIGLDLY
jgi:hypothetical protein